MTREEAINQLGWLKCKTNKERQLEAIDMAIEALEVEPRPIDPTVEVDLASGAVPRSALNGVVNSPKVTIHLDRPKEWIPCTKDGLPLTESECRRAGRRWYGYKCSNCNFIYKGNALTESRYCQWCGAMMKGADDE